MTLSFSARRTKNTVVATTAILGAVYSFVTVDKTPDPVSKISSMAIFASIALIAERKNKKLDETVAAEIKKEDARRFGFSL